MGQIIKKDFVILKIKRSEFGVEVYCKSELLENFFNGITATREGLELNTLPVTQFREANFGAYLSTDGTVKGKRLTSVVNYQGITLDGWGAGLIHSSSNNINMSFLLAKGLNEGITIYVKGVYSSTVVRSFIVKAKDFFKYIFTEYLKPVEACVEMHTTTMESEAINGI
jgi:hypothetical protein